MTHDALERQEEASRDLIETLGKLSRNTRASPGLAAMVMAGADQHSWLQRRFFARLSHAFIRPMTPSIRIAVAALIVLVIIGAVPQYRSWINAYIMGVPSEAIHQARIQEKLWEKNFACATQLDRSSSNYAVITGEHVVMVAWACPSGDVLVTVESATDDISARSVWIPLNSGDFTASLFDAVVPKAFAATDVLYVTKRKAPMVTVLCQKWLPNRFIKRRIQLANDRCVDETINTRTGRVTKRLKAPCDREC
jgi:hypothetical protein